VTPYGASKLESERVVRDTGGLRALILRPGVVYGPTDRAVLPLFQAAARGVLPLVGRPNTAYTFVYIDDVVRAIVAAVEKVDVTGTIFVGHSQPVTARALLDAIQEAMPRRARIIPIPMTVTRAAAMACDVVGRILQKPMPLNTWRYAELAAEGFVCRVDRLRDELGIVAGVGLRDGMAQTAEWYRRVGWLRR
jgi:nucleoside-diphosphate-sugar epimerase